MYKTLVVVDEENAQELVGVAEVISFEKYLHDYPRLNEPKTRIINLCDTRQYLSKGYYCSLLAEARNHLVLPSVKTINRLRHDAVQEDAPALTLSELEDCKLESREHYFYFGRSIDPQLQKLAQRLLRELPSPVLGLYPGNDDNGSYRLQACSFSELSAEQKQRCVESLVEFTQTVWRISNKTKRHRWEMAILINPNEKDPPSNREAIARFVKAASKQGIHAEPLQINQLQNIAYYDALFIRETTAIDHYTYRLANRAEREGLVVIDDPASILRCCNKVYLHDAFSYQKVPSLHTEVVSDVEPATIDKLEQRFGFPLVLKMPEGSFSRGVFKVADREQLRNKLGELLKDSALVLAQEYLYTEYDWRIGVLGGRAIYACRYLMARNHWQIYNHGVKRFSSGGFETLPTFEVPRAVLQAALKASLVVGDGLYGVDIKAVDNKAYVLEVNDNPNIDHKIEDAYLGDELYMQVMAEFQRRLESRGR